MFWIFIRAAPGGPAARERDCSARRARGTRRRLLVISSSADGVAATTPSYVLTSLDLRKTNYEYIILYYFPRPTLNLRGTRYVRNVRTRMRVYSELLLIKNCLFL